MMSYTKDDRCGGSAWKGCQISVEYTEAEAKWDVKHIVVLNGNCDSEGLFTGTRTWAIKKKQDGSILDTCTEQFFDGMRQGNRRCQFGDLIHEMTFRDGLLQGLYVTKGKNGELIGEEHFADGVSEYEREKFSGQLSDKEFQEILASEQKWINGARLKCKDYQLDIPSPYRIVEKRAGEREAGVQSEYIPKRLFRFEI